MGRVPLAELSGLALSGSPGQVSLCLALVSLHCCSFGHEISLSVHSYSRTLLWPQVQ